MTTVTDKTTVMPDSPQRLSGMARLRESQTWRTACNMSDAAMEAERLCEAINRLIFDAYQPSGDLPSVAAEAAASQQVREMADEAFQLLMKAVEYLRDLTRDRDEIPF